MISYNKRGRLAYPDVLFQMIPAYECLVVGQLIEAVVMLDFEAVLLELGSYEEEFLSPLLNHVLYTVEYRLFVDKLYRQL